MDLIVVLRSMKGRCHGNRFLIHSVAFRCQSWLPHSHRAATADWAPIRQSRPSNGVFARASGPQVHHRVYTVWEETDCRDKGCVLTLNGLESRCEHGVITML